jgi:hypothetical protein
MNLLQVDIQLYVDVASLSHAPYSSVLSDVQQYAAGFNQGSFSRENYFVQANFTECNHGGLSAALNIPIGVPYAGVYTYIRSLSHCKLLPLLGLCHQLCLSGF